MAAAQKMTNQLPEWEGQSNGAAKEAGCSKSTGFFGFHFIPHLKRRVRSDRKYLGLSRRVFCLVLAIFIVSLLALIIGLAVGLSLRNR